MAQSRLEKIGTIFSRTTSLLRGGAMKEEDKPIWYVIYEAFPPKVEPCYSRPVQKIPVREIFYKEDVIRAKFQKENKKFLSSSLTSTRTESKTQRFISIYQEMEKSGIPEVELYPKAMEAYTARLNEFPRNKATESAENNESIVDKKEETSVDLKKIFTD